MFYYMILAVLIVSGVSFGRHRWWNHRPSFNEFFAHVALVALGLSLFATFYMGSKMSPILAVIEFLGATIVFFTIVLPYVVRKFRHYNWLSFVLALLLGIGSAITMWWAIGAWYLFCRTVDKTVDDIRHKL